MKIENGAFILDAAELQILMRTLKISAAPHLNFMSSDLPDQSLQTARASLQSNGILDNAGKIMGTNKSFFQVVFSPHRLLILVSDLPDKGRQEMIFLNRQGATLLYTRPSETTYRLELFTQAEQISALLKELLPFKDFPVGERLEIPTQALETLTGQIFAKDMVSAKFTLKLLPWPTIEKDFLLGAIQNRKISGSLAVLDLSETGQGINGYSLAFLADHQTLWLFQQTTPNENTLTAQRNGTHFIDLLDITSQRLAGTTMLNEPLEKNKIASFSLSPDEFAFCLRHHGRTDLAQNLIQSHFPGADNTQANYEIHMFAALDRLTARGWSRMGSDGKITLAGKLSSAISAIVKYDFVLQVNIIRPNLSANATLHVIHNEMFTSVLRPETNIYVLEHGSVSALAAYLSNLFPDFGKTSNKTSVEEMTISYAYLTSAMQQNDLSAATRILEQAGMNTVIAKAFAQDISEALYHGTFVRINVDSHASQDTINGAAKPLLLLLKGPAHSWLYYLSPTNEKGSLVPIKNREDFLTNLSSFTA